MSVKPLLPLPHQTGQPAIDIMARTRQARFATVFDEMHRAIRFVVDQINAPENSKYEFASYRHGAGFAMLEEALREADSLIRENRR